MNWIPNRAAAMMLATNSSSFDAATATTGKLAIPCAALLIALATSACAAPVTIDETSAHRHGIVVNAFSDKTPVEGDVIFCDVTYNASGVATGGGVLSGGVGCVTTISDILQFRAIVVATGPVNLTWTFISDGDNPKDGPADTGIPAGYVPHSNTLYYAEPATFPFVYTPGVAPLIGSEPGWIMDTTTTLASYKITSDCSCTLADIPEPPTLSLAMMALGCAVASKGARMRRRLLGTRR
jgi:hypothetical protein